MISGELFLSLIEYLLAVLVGAVTFEEDLIITISSGESSRDLLYPLDTYISSPEDNARMWKALELVIEGSWS